MLILRHKYSAPSMKISLRIKIQDFICTVTFKITHADIDGSKVFQLIFSYNMAILINMGKNIYTVSFHNTHVKM